MLVLTCVGAFILSRVLFTEGQISGWGSWILYAILGGLGIAVILSVYLLIFEREQAKGLLRYVKGLFNKLKGKNKVKEEL